MRSRRNIVIMLIVMLAIGFASVATTLFIQGTSLIGENKSDFDVYFSKAYENGFEKKELITSKTTIDFSTELKTVGETYVLDYDVTNGSSNYDSEITLNCTESNSYFIVKNVFNDKEPLKAKETRSGRLTVTLLRPVTEQDDYVVNLSFVNNAIERDSFNSAEIMYEDVNYLRQGENNSNIATLKTYDELVSEYGEDTVYDMTNKEYLSLTEYMPSFLGYEIDRRNVETINFSNENKVPENAIYSWDVSEKQNGSIMAYTMDEDSDGLYEIFIGQDGGVIANPNSAYLLSYFYNVKEINGLDNLNTKNVTNMGGMFAYNFVLENLDVSTFNTSNVTNMSGMFSSNEKIVSLSISNFDTSNVTRMTSMFEYCYGLKELDLSNFDTSKVTNMGGLVYYCINLENVNLSGFDTSKVTNMKSMFCGCEKLLDLDVLSFDTSSVTNMSYMFYECKSLTNLNVTSLDTSNVTTMAGMFSYCEKLLELDLSYFNTSNVEDMSGMFSNCQSLTTLDVSSFNTSKVTSMQSMFYGKSEKEPNNLQEIKGLENFDTSNVTDMGWMFYGCGNITFLDVSHFNTSKVTRFYSMFCNCFKLENLDVSNFDTSSAVELNYMFDDCRSLKQISVTNFNTSKVTNMRGMFGGCWVLETLNLTNFDTSNVEDMSGMFRDCKVISTSITIKGTKCTIFSKVGNDSDGMFRNAATSAGAQITVNYTADASDLVDQMIATKSTNSNVVKGSVVA